MWVEFFCELCGKKVRRKKRSDSKFRFCSSSCAAKVAIKKANQRNRFAEKNPFWRGGKWKNQQGYVLIYCPGHPYFNHQKGPYVFEHRLVMEKHLGRYLKPKERVHHINGNCSDNRIENLRLLGEQSEHIKIHINNGDLGGRISYEKGKKNIKCKVCGKEIVPNSPHQKYCKVCRKKIIY